MRSRLTRLTRDANRDSEEKREERGEDYQDEDLVFFCLISVFKCMPYGMYHRAVTHEG